MKVSQFHYLLKCDQHSKVVAKLIYFTEQKKFCLKTQLLVFLDLNYVGKVLFENYLRILSEQPSQVEDFNQQCTSANHFNSL